MPRTRSTARAVRESRDAAAKRGVLSHMELVRSFGEALIRAADTFVTQQRISEAESDWRDDLPFNIGEANREFHRALGESMNRVSEVFFGRSTDDTADFEAYRPRGPAPSPATGPTAPGGTADTITPTEGTIITP